MLNLIRNEWMKLWHKTATWVMLGLLVLFVGASLGLTKWLSVQEDNFNTESGGNGIGISIETEEGLASWEEETAGELAFIQDQLDDPSLSNGERKQLEGREKVLDYRLANSVAPVDRNSRESILMDANGVGGIVLLLTVIVAAGIVASEFSQGTIKMLLTRPVKRWKILMSKFVTVNLFGILLMIVGYAVFVSLAFLLFQSGDGVVLEWDGNAVVEASVWEKSLYMLLLSFGSVFVTAAFAFMIGSVFRSSSLAIGLSIFIYFTGSSISMLLARFNIAKYIVFTHLDLTQFETGYKIVEDITMPFSLAVLAVYVVVFLVISFATFMKRDVTA